jgi:hypothetical protein
MRKLLNIEKFLKSQGLKTTKYEDFKLTIEFIDNEKLNKAWDEFIMSRKVAEATEDQEKQNSLYLQSWDNLHKLEKEIFPKLRPITDALNDFYSSREFEYKNLIFFEIPKINYYELDINEDIYNYFKNSKDFMNVVKREFEDFDTFLGSYN